MADDNGFANVDLEIGARTRAQLAPLIEQFEGKLLEMFLGRIGGLYRAHYESSGPPSIRGRIRREYNATVMIHELADAVDGLNTSGRRAWNAAVIRDFNVGVNIARGVRTSETPVEADAVRRVAVLGARVVFTAYQEAATRRPSAPRKRKTR